MAVNRFVTIAACAKSEYVEKRSRFLGVAVPIQTAEQAATVVASIQAEHYDARHHCYAYRLKNGSSRYADDGEPAGTAGLPILEVLTRKDITDCLVVVTRYFGGTLLGTGGLVRSYTAAASQALDAASTVCMEQYVDATLRCNYNQYGRLEPLILRMGGIVGESVFDEQITIPFRLPVKNTSVFSAQLQELFAGQLTTLWGKTWFGGCHQGSWQFEPMEP